MIAYGRRHVVGGACLAPAVAEFTCADGETGAHVGVAEIEDGAFLIFTLRDYEAEMAISVLRDAQVGHGTRGRIKLCQIAAAGLSVEDRDNLHGRLPCL